MRISKERARITLGKAESRLWFAKDLAGNRCGTKRDAASADKGLDRALHKVVLEAAQKLAREASLGLVEIVATYDWNLGVLVADVQMGAHSFRHVPGAFGKMHWPNPITKVKKNLFKVVAYPPAWDENELGYDRSRTTEMIVRADGTEGARRAKREDLVAALTFGKWKLWKDGAPEASPRDVRKFAAMPVTHAA